MRRKPSEIEEVEKFKSRIQAIKYTEGIRAALNAARSALRSLDSGSLDAVRRDLEWIIRDMESELRFSDPTKYKT